MVSPPRASPRIIYVTTLVVSQVNSLLMLSECEKSRKSPTQYTNKTNSNSSIWKVGELTDNSFHLTIVVEVFPSVIAAAACLEPKTVIYRLVLYNFLFIDDKVHTERRFYSFFITISLVY